MAEQKFITIPQLARILGVSRIAVYKSVRQGKIPAVKIGRTYVIADKTMADILGKETSPAGRKQIDAAIRKTVDEYGDLLKKLGKE